MRLLAVEDDPALAEQILRGLAAEGFTVDTAADGEEALHLGGSENYDAIVLDLGLPEVDGATVLRTWRADGVTTPVLILTARSGWRERVEGLNAGGDDYLGKPFHMEELVARLRALIRRASGGADPVLRRGDVEHDTRSGRTRRAGELVSLTAHEAKLLSILMHRPEEVHSKTDLAEQIYGYYEERDSNTIEVFVGRLRKKLGSRLIETVRGRGYALGSGSGGDGAGGGENGAGGPADAAR